MLKGKVKVMPSLKGKGKGKQFQRGRVKGKVKTWSFTFNLTLPRPTYNPGSAGETLKIVSHMVGRRVEVCGPDGLVMGGRMVFGEVIGTIRWVFAPIDVKLTLAHTIADDPIETHIDRF